MRKNPHIRLSSVITGLSSALDLVNWLVVNHHRQVTAFAGAIAEEMGFSEEDRTTITIAAALHDIGAISFDEKFNLAVEDERIMKHAELGYHLMSRFTPLIRAAELVRYHHVPWNEGLGLEHKGRRVPVGSHILHLADRAAVLIRSDQSVLKQSKYICDEMRKEEGRAFMPETVDAFLQLSSKESFWLDAAFLSADRGIANSGMGWNIELDMNKLLQLSEVFRMLIDFRSSHTAAHSKDVAHLSAALARLAGFSEQESAMFHIAGNLHDLGKLAVPVEVLEKNGPLSQDELYIMRSHSFHTYRILDKIGQLEEINEWASLHHECLNGSGYPFRYHEAELSLGSRIVAVADVLSALSENRSYRPAMQPQEVMGILQEMAKARKLDPAIVSLVERHYHDLQDIKISAFDVALKEFQQIKREAVEVGGGV